MMSWHEKKPDSSCNLQVVTLWIPKIVHDFDSIVRIDVIDQGFTKEHGGCGEISRLEVQKFA